MTGKRPNRFKLERAEPCPALYDTT